MTVASLVASEHFQKHCLHPTAQSISFWEQQLLQYQDEITEWTEKYETLKTVNSMLGSDENKRETKLKINSLIREIDQCIAQLAE